MQLTSQIAVGKGASGGDRYPSTVQPNAPPLSFTIKQFSTASRITLGQAGGGALGWSAARSLFGPLSPFPTADYLATLFAYRICLPLVPFPDCN
jgi:hypothetical protein